MSKVIVLSRCFPGENPKIMTICSSREIAVKRFEAYLMLYNKRDSLEKKQVFIEQFKLGSHHVVTSLEIYSMIEYVVDAEYHE